MNISIALLSIQALLTAAEPDDPQDWEVAEMYKKNPKEYEAKAREWVRLYAQEGMITKRWCCFSCGSNAIDPEKYCQRKEAGLCS